MLDTLFRSAEFWAAVGQKTRRPLENVTASVRILGVVPEGDTAHSVNTLYNAATRAGHPPLSWPAPNGYPDVHAAWRSAGGVVETWNTHRMLIGDWEDGLTTPDPVGLVAGRPAARWASTSTACASACASRRSSRPTATRWWRSSAATRPPRSAA